MIRLRHQVTGVVVDRENRVDPATARCAARRRVGQRGEHRGDGTENQIAIEVEQLARGERDGFGGQRRSAVHAVTFGDAKLKRVVHRIKLNVRLDVERGRLNHAAGGGLRRGGEIRRQGGKKSS